MAGNSWRLIPVEAPVVWVSFRERVEYLNLGLRTAEEQLHFRVPSVTLLQGPGETASGDNLKSNGLERKRWRALNSNPEGNHPAPHPEARPGSSCSGFPGSSSHSVRILLPASSMDLGFDCPLYLPGWLETGFSLDVATAWPNQRAAGIDEGEPQKITSFKARWGKLRIVYKIVDSRRKPHVQNHREKILGTLFYFLASFFFTGLLIFGEFFCLSDIGE